MTSFEVAAERDRRGIRGEMTARGRGLAAQQPVGPPRWKLATLSWFGVFPVVTAILALAEPWLDRLPLVARTITRRNRRCPGPRSRALPPISARRRAARRCCRRAIHRYLVNAGTFGPQDFFETPDSEWTRFFEINVMSGVRLSRAYLPGMIERNWGRVVFLSSESVKPLASPSPRDRTDADTAP
jgi:hypothetical protein